MDSDGYESLPTRDSMQFGAHETLATRLSMRTLYSNTRESPDGRDVMNSDYQPPDPASFQFGAGSLPEAASSEPVRDRGSRGRRRGNSRGWIKP
jgi:hypothetical protein